MIRLKTFYSTIYDGPMSLDRKFYSSNMTDDEIRNDFTDRRLKFGKKEGFLGLKIITPKQKDKEIVKIDREIVNSKLDLYDLNIEADILLMDDMILDTAIAYPVNDDPVLFLQDLRNGIVATSLCNPEAINKDIPKLMVETLYKEYGSNQYDLVAYIGPHAKNIFYDDIPDFVHEYGIWESALDCRDFVCLNISEAIIKQLVNSGLDKDTIAVSLLDTIKNPVFYSTINVSKNNGVFYEGCFFNYEEEKKKIK